jgi:hypothetical protein
VLSQIHLITIKVLQELSALLKQIFKILWITIGIDRLLIKEWFFSSLLYVNYLNKVFSFNPTICFSHISDTHDSYDSKRKMNFGFNEKSSDFCLCSFTAGLDSRK